MISYIKAATCDRGRHVGFEANYTIDCSVIISSFSLIIKHLRKKRHLVWVKKVKTFIKWFKLMSLIRANELNQVIREFDLVWLIFSLKFEQMSWTYRAEPNCSWTLNEPNPSRKKSSCRTRAVFWAEPVLIESSRAQTSSTRLDSFPALSIVHVKMRFYFITPPLYCFYTPRCGTNFSTHKFSCITPFVFFFLYFFWWYYFSLLF